jgi:hypothetical protein
MQTRQHYEFQAPLNDTLREPIMCLYVFLLLMLQHKIDRRYESSSPQEFDTPLWIFQAGLHLMSNAKETKYNL